MATVPFASSAIASWPTVPCVGDETSEEQIDRHVNLALVCTQPGRKLAERRREKRNPYPYPIYLTPCDSSRIPQVERTLVVVGKHLGNGGVDFYHREPIPFRHVICSLTVGDTRWISLLLELTWCRFSKHGWYDNGGRFVAVVESPLG